MYFSVPCGAAMPIPLLAERVARCGRGRAGRRPGPVRASRKSAPAGKRHALIVAAAREMAKDAVPPHRQADVHPQIPSAREIVPWPTVARIRKTLEALAQGKPPHLDGRDIKFG
jgi:hypothetical protein